MKPATNPAIAVELERAAPISQRARNAELRIGLAILGLLLFVFWVGPLFYTASPTDQDIANKLADPSSHALLGTDNLGRDQLARLLYAGRLDIPLAIGAVITPFILGVAVGAIAGYFGGAVDSFLMRLVDVVVAFPFYILVIALVFVIGPGITAFLVAVAAVEWVAFARIVRGQVSHLRTRDYVTAARLAGFSDVRILRKHILPGALVYAVHYAAADIVFILLALVSLGFLGLGVAPPTAEWGSMIADGRPDLATHWWLVAAPGFAIALTGIGLALIGDGLASRWSTE